MPSPVCGGRWRAAPEGGHPLCGRRAPFRPSGTFPRRREKARRRGLTMGFFLEVLTGGLLAGVLYSLVALGFVLIFKASGVFNFAQGAMVFFAALTFVSLLERGVNIWLALVITLAVMVVLGLATEKVVLRPLVNQPPITLF